MADWTRGMTRTYEWWTVNPETWGDAERLLNVTGAVVTRDMDDPLMEHSSYDMDARGGEGYVRTYLITEQDGVRERWPLSTHLMQAPSHSFDGMRGMMTADGDSPLIELSDERLPVCYTVEDGFATAHAARLLRAYGKMPVTVSGDAGSIADPCSADEDTSPLDFISTLAEKGEMQVTLDGRGCAMVGPKPQPTSLMPVFTFNDGNSSILRPQVTVSSNIADVPNVVEVVFSAPERCLFGTAANDDPADANSTVMLGRRKVMRIVNPDGMPDEPTQADVDDLAKRTLKHEGATVYEVEFEHAFHPDVKIGSAVRLAYSRMGLNVVAQVVSQEIQCTPGCLVRCRARYTK